MNTTLLRHAIMGRGKGYRVFPRMRIAYPWRREFSFKASPGLVQVPVSIRDYATLSTLHNDFFTRDKLKSEIRKVLASRRPA